MPRKSHDRIEEERKAVAAVLRSMPDGATQETLRERVAESVGREISYPAIRNRLLELERDGEIDRVDGRRRLPRYRAATMPSADLAGTNDEYSRARDRNWLGRGERPGDVEPVGLSVEAQSIRARLVRGRDERNDAGHVSAYDSTLLARYQPGHTWLLAAPLRERLARTGATAYLSAPPGSYPREVVRTLADELAMASLRFDRRDRKTDTEQGSAHRSGRPSRTGADERRGPGGGGGSAAPGELTRPLMRQTLLNHRAAVEHLVMHAATLIPDERNVLDAHALLSENLLANPEDEGRLRTRPHLEEAGTAPSASVAQFIAEQYEQLVTKWCAIPDPFEAGFFGLVFVPYLRPFTNVNGATARLIANLGFVRRNLAPVSFGMVPVDAYRDGMTAIREQRRTELLRDVFVAAYERSCEQFAVLRRGIGDPDPIRLHYRDELRQVVGEWVRGQQPPVLADLASWGSERGIPDMHRGAFAVAARDSLTRLRPTLLVRYGLTLEEFEAWKLKAA